MKQSAVEWLVYQLQQNKFITESQIHLAKEMEKEQIIDSANHGANFESSPFKDAEDYYNETFKNK
jgi:hypothetical protein